MQNSEEIESLKDSGKKKKSYKKIKEKNNYNNCVFFIYLLIISFTFIYIIIIIQIKFSSHKKEEYINHKLTYNITPIDPDIPKRKIKVKYIDFWPSFKIENFDIHHILQERYEVIISDKPEYVFFGEFGRQNLNIEKKFNCIKIFLSIENRKPNFLRCDYAIGLHYIDKGDRYCRKPTDTSKLSEINSVYNISKIKNIDIKNKKFCAWVVSNGGSSTRNLFYQRLSEYKRIDSGGKFKNNIGYIVGNKKEFLKNYKFSICFENSKKPGYVSEKIFDAFEAGTIPIYFGDDSIKELINNKAYIHVKDKYDFDEKIELIKKIDQDDNLYEQMIKEKIVINDNIYEHELQKFKNFIYHIIEQDLEKAKRFKRKDDDDEEE